MQPDITTRRLEGQDTHSAARCDHEVSPEVAVTASITHEAAEPALMRGMSAFAVVRISDVMAGA
jgi:molybdopterin-binding protein